MARCCDVNSNKQLVTERYDVALKSNIRIFRCQVCGEHQLESDRTANIPKCLHPNSRYVGEESGENCRGQQYERERWQCPDCGASWFEGVRFLPVKKVI